MKIELVLNKKEEAVLVERAARDGVEPNEYAQRLVIAYANDPLSVLPNPVSSLTKKIKRNLEAAMKNYRSGKSVHVTSFKELLGDK